MLDAARWGGTPPPSQPHLNSLTGRGVRVDVISPEVVRQNLARIGAELADRYGRVSNGETDPSTGP